jgi:hypothetical protein
LYNYSDGSEVRESDTPGSLWEGSLAGVIGTAESKLPTLSFWSAANDSLLADMASKYLVHDANATGIGRSISCKKKEKGFSFQMQLENTKLCPLISIDMFSK